MSREDLKMREETPDEEGSRHESGLFMRSLTYEMRPSQLTLERYLLGELSAEEASALEAWSERDAELRAQLNALKVSDHEMRQRFAPSSEVLARVQARRAPVKISLWAHPWTFAVVGGLLMMLAARAYRALYDSVNSGGGRRHQELAYHQSDRDSHRGQTRLKGSQDAPQEWEVYLAPSAGEEARLLTDLAEIKPHQTIGFRVYPRGATHYMVIGRDDSEEWYLGAPHPSGSSPVTAAPLPLLSEGATSVDLVETLVFDETLGVERLYLVLCTSAAPYMSVRRSIDTLISSDTPAPTWPAKLSSLSCEVQRYRLTKVAP